MEDHHEIQSNCTFLAAQLGGGRWDFDQQNKVYVGHFPLTDNTEQSEVDRLLDLSQILAKQGISIDPPSFANNNILIRISPAALAALRARSAPAIPQMQPPLSHQVAAIVWQQDGDIFTTVVEDFDRAEALKAALNDDGLPTSVSIDDAGVHFTVEGATTEQLGRMSQPFQPHK